MSPCAIDSASRGSDRRPPRTEQAGEQEAVALGQQPPLEYATDAPYRRAEGQALRHQTALAKYASHLSSDHDGRTATAVDLDGVRGDRKDRTSRYIAAMSLDHHISAWTQGFDSEPITRDRCR